MNNCICIIGSFIFLINLSFSNLIHPENNAELHYIHVLFEINQEPGVSYNNFKIAASSEFSEGSLIANHVTTSLIYIDRANIDWDETYYWKVDFLDESENLISSSDIYSFSTSEKISNVDTQFYEDESEYSEGLTIFGAFVDDMSVVFDKNGNEIWNAGDSKIIYYNTDYYGQLFGCHRLNSNEYANDMNSAEFNLNLEFIWKDPNTEYAHHDLLQLPNGNYLGIVESVKYEPIPYNVLSNSTKMTIESLGWTIGSTPFPWVGDKIVIWNSSGDIVWSWDCHDYLDKQDYDTIGGTWDTVLSLGLRYDWTHLNAIAYDDSDINNPAIYASIRHLSRIIKIDYNTKEVMESIGIDMPSGDVSLGNDIGMSWQHGVFITDDGNLVILDNGNLSTQLRNTDYPETRALEVDFDSGEVLWEHALDQEYYGPASANAQKLNNGNYLIGTIGSGGTVFEVSSDNRTIWKADLNISELGGMGGLHRVNRIVDLYPISYSVTIPIDFNNENGTNTIIRDSDETIEFIIHNDGYLDETFNYHFDKCNEILDEGSIVVEAGSNQVLQFSGIYSDIVKLYIEPEHRPDLYKLFPICMVSDCEINEDSECITLSNSLDIQIPKEIKINNIYPNPFNPVTQIEYSLNKFSFVSIEVFDIKGKLIESLFNKNQYPGNYQIMWNGSRFSSGLYIIQLRSRNQVLSNKVLLIK